MSCLLYTSPAGHVFDQSDARRLAKMDNLVFVCGHYEGIDQRFIDECVNEELSIGDFVVTGGEIPAMAITDAVCRLVPGVLSDAACFEDESHWAGTLEYPQYLSLIHILRPLGIRKCGIRLDSGDMTYLTKKARKMLDEAGWPECEISVSNSLDEYLIQDLLRQGAQIDMFGVGERLITAKSEPVFGGVYKPVSYTHLKQKE